MANGRYLQFPEIIYPGAVASAHAGGSFTQLDIAIRIQPKLLAPPSNETIIGMWATNFLGSPANIRGYRIYFASTGNLNLAGSSDGTAANSTAVASTVTIASAGYSNGQAFWIRVTWRASDGRVQFFTAADSTTIPSSWTQLGADRTIAYAQLHGAAGSSWLGQNPLISTESEREPYTGKIYDVVIKRTIDATTPTSHMDLSRIPLATSYGTWVDAYSISWVISANGGVRGWGIRRLVESGGTATGRTFLV